MLGLVDLHKELLKNRRKDLNGIEVMKLVNDVLKNVDSQHESIRAKLNSSQSNNTVTNFKREKLEEDKIFHISQIRTICIQYRLKFLNTSFFKGDYPVETISKINELENSHDVRIEEFKIVAPSILFRLKKADDPLLFAPLGNDLYYLIDKWGNDINLSRKIKYWPVRSFDNFAFSLLITSIVLTGLSHRLFFGEEGTVAQFFVVFLFFLKGVIGMALFYGVAIGKNFTEFSWKSKHDKIQ